MADRPRDRLGRPLPPGSPLAVPDVPDRPDLTDGQSWTTALAYLGQGMPFHAHEVFEMRWRQASGAERPAWRALAQWGAALTHHARGNPVGARALAERALETLGEAASVPACVDVVAVRTSCRSLLA